MTPKSISYHMTIYHYFSLQNTIFNNIHIKGLYLIIATLKYLILSYIVHTIMTIVENFQHFSHMINTFKLHSWQVYTNIGVNKPHLVSTGWAMLALIEAGQVRLCSLNLKKKKTLISVQFKFSQSSFTLQTSSV